MPLAYTSDDWSAIEKFLNYSKVRIQSRVGAPLQTCSAERFIQAVIDIAATGCGGDRVKRLLTKTALSEESNHARMTEYLDRLKGVKPTWPGIQTDRSNSESDIVDAFPALSDAAANAAKRAGIETSPLFSVPLADGPYCHKTVPGSAGVALDGSSRKMVTLFYQAHGGEYYLVAWGVHFGKTRDGKDAVYQVRGVAPGCILKERYILRPPGK